MAGFEDAKAADARMARVAREMRHATAYNAIGDLHTFLGCHERAEVAYQRSASAWQRAIDLQGDGRP